MIPAGNTDLVLPAIGEEWGFVGVAAVFLLFGVPDFARLPHRRARGDRITASSWRWAWRACSRLRCC